MGQRLLSFALRISIAAPILGVILGKIVITYFNFCNKKTWLETTLYVVIIAIFITAICCILKCVFHYLRQKGSRDRITCDSIEPVGNEFFSTSYPFLTISYGLLDKEVEILLPWLLSVVILFVLLTNNTIIYNFLYKLSGYNLYKVRSPDRNIWIIITKESKSSLIPEKLTVVQIDNYTYLDISNNT